ncbi:MAG TPA: hypothetical protein VHE58_01070 [Burkholderiales bacterium]|nr:hypothetical protein [Burkholderiales bacterium]
MDDAALRFLVEKAKLAYYAADTVIFSPQHGEPERFFIVQRGCVQNAVKSGGGGCAIGELMQVVRKFTR